MRNILKNGPLNAAEHIKIVIFMLLLIPTIFPFLVGIIPVLFLAFGYYMMKKNNDFSSVEASVKAVNILFMLAAILSVLFAVYYGIEYFTRSSSSYGRMDLDMALITLGFMVTAGFYFLVVKYLYFIPLQNHSEWVAVNGTFSNKPKKPTPDTSRASVDILQSEKLKPYSVADELLKWAKLKEDGLISEEEFNEARSKLLNRS